jgi:hypothetical protein
MGSFKVCDTIVYISTWSSCNVIQSSVVVLIPLQLTLSCILKHYQDHVCFLYDLTNGTTLAQEIVVSPIFPIIEIIAIEDNELHVTFLYVTFGSQS